MLSPNMAVFFELGIPFTVMLALFFKILNAILNLEVKCQPNTSLPI